MTENIDLKKLEKKVWKSFFVQDGIMDIFFGFMFLVLGFRPFLDDIGITGPWDAILSTSLILSAPLLFILGKKFIITPRMGIVKFSRERKVKHMKVVILIAFFIIATNIILFLSLTKGFPRVHLTGLVLYLKRLGIGLFLWGVPLSILAYFLDYRHIYFIAVLGALSESIYAYAGSIGFIVSGSIILIMGLVIFFRFLRDYPLPAEESE